MQIDPASRFGRALLAIELGQAASMFAQADRCVQAGDGETLYCTLRVLQARIASLVGRLSPCAPEA